jgi:hypothetical protein
MPVSIFDTRTMLRMLENMPQPKTFLRDMFFRNRVTFDTEYVDIDIRKGKRRLAPFVSPRIGSQTVDRTGYRTETYRPVMVAPDTITTAEDLQKRAFGENYFGTMTPDQRAAQKLAADMVELDDMITRREEWMAANALFAGAIDMVGEGVDQTVDFGLTNKEALAAGARWNEGTADIIGNLTAWSRVCLQGSGYKPTHAIMGTDAADEFMRNEKVQKMMDLRRVDVGAINPAELPQGVTYIGNLRGPSLGIDIYTYEEWYYDEAAATEKPMVPAKSVLLANPAARMDMLYGAVVDVNRGTFALPRVPKSWTQEKPSARFVQIASRPLPVPHEIDSIFVGTVLA